MTSARPLLVDSVTGLGAEHAGAVVVTGSHGGLIAAAYLAAVGVRAAVTNDAGRGRDDAGIAGLAALDRIGMAAAAVSHRSARIGDAMDTHTRGVIAARNAVAAACGVEIGMPCKRAAGLLADAPIAHGTLPFPEEARAVLAAAAPGMPAIVGLDSIGLVTASDAGDVLVIGSHGALHGGDPGTALAVAAAGAFFHDAGRGRDDAGITRLPVLDGRGMPAAAVDHRSARIGDARSLWDTGIVSVTNAHGARLGIAAGMDVRTAARAMQRSRSAG